MRRALACALVCGLGYFASTRSAAAENLLGVSGRVALADGLTPAGVKVKLQVDLNRNAKLESFETVSANVTADGSYTVQYDVDPKDVDLKLFKFVAELVADFQARGFDSLLDDGPLPVVVSFEREGYGTVVRRLSTLFERPNLDATLAPLTDVQCASGACLSADGGVRFGEFPGGTQIARAYADAFDPGLDTARFPGLFADSSNNLLVSSGFAEINLYREDGSPVHEVASAVNTRFEAKRASWATLPDLESNTGRIELPMYSFDPASGEWRAEQDGELRFADGRVVPEAALSALRDGSFDRQVFVDFSSAHFSTFNCDAPIPERACVKGRVVAKATGKALLGVTVAVEGITYTGSAGSVVTGLDGTFATDLRKSELPTEDLDRNGERGELLEAHVTATGTGVFVGPAFETPTQQGSVGQVSRPGCKPAQCDCLDLGDIEVEFEEPRLCELGFESLFNGEHVVGSGGPLEAGDAVVGASVRATLVGVQLPQATAAAACERAGCGPAIVPASGLTTLVVPVIGDSPQVRIDASWSTEIEGALHYYKGSRVVTGCARGESAVGDLGALELTHSKVTGLGDFIASLGDGVSAVSPRDDQLRELKDPMGCGCHLVQTRSSSGPLLLLGLLFGAALRRRRANA